MKHRSRNLVLIVALALVLAVVLSTTAFAHVPVGTNYYRIPTTQKVVALTFDDIWDDAYMTEILDVLAAEGVKATFFPTGKGLANTSALVQRAIAEGHDFGSHGYTHKYLTAYKTDGQIMWQIRNCRLALQAQGVTPKPLYRTPGGKMGGTWGSIQPKTRVMRVLRATGYVNVLWSLNANDAAYGQTVQGCIEQVVYKVHPTLYWPSGKLRARAVNIVLMHTQNPICPKALPGIIRGLKARGYTFVLIRDYL
jgi:peptidoglycan/xylan/chitin deacetylase (PgdA/CDA1 family)